MKQEQAAGAQGKGPPYLPCRYHKRLPDRARGRPRPLAGAVIRTRGLLEGRKLYNKGERRITYYAK